MRRPLDIEYAGGRLRCYPDSTCASRIFYFSRLYDWDEMRFLQRYLRPGDGFIDGGANIGTYTMLAASLVGPAGSVDAFEPSPITAARLRENVALNELSQVRVHASAIGDVAGTAPFVLGWDVTDGVYTPNDILQQQLPRVEVEVARLDESLGHRSYAAAKLDIEGFELAALRGGEKHVEAANPPVWLLEVFANQLEKYGASAAELFGWLRAHDYEIYWYDSDRNELKRDRGTVSHEYNVFAIANEHFDEVVTRLNAAVADQRASIN